LGLPFIAIGLFYDQGYFKQHLDSDGWQQEEYLDTKVENVPMKPALGPDGKPLTVTIETRNGSLLVKVWKMSVGRVSLYLLDSDVEGNRPEDRELTSRLYGGDHRTRIRQELVLGVGGVRALKALGIVPGAYHLNEGHSAFAPLEVVRTMMEDDGVSFDEALRETAQHTVFTTHTPVPAGHDRFDGGLIVEHMGLGRVETHNNNETFCMTVLALKLSRRANAVSSLHGYVSRRMWAHLWPWRVEEEIPIGHITNGVHVSSWLAWQMQQLYDRYFPVNWLQQMGQTETWQNVSQIDPGELWETHYALKNQLLSFVRRRVSRQYRRPQHVRPQRVDHRLCATVCHLQTRRPDPDRSRGVVRDRAKRRLPRAVYFCRQGPPGRRARQAVHQANCQPAARSQAGGARGLYRRLRHQRLPAFDPGRRRVAQ
jgi:starch phosphorylase